MTQDPIGLAGGANAYRYPHNPNTLMDPLGLSSNCVATFTRLKWRPIARDWKVVDYKFLPGNNKLIDSVLDAISSVKPGIYARKMIPVVADLQLEEEVQINSMTCKDGSSQVESTEPTGRYRENHFNPTTTYDGTPVWVGPTTPSPSMRARWGGLVK